MERSGYRTISGMVFGLIAIGQGIRAAMKVSVQVGATSIPIWASWVAVVVAGGFCIWAFRSSAEKRRAA
jgi:TRAP-type C4-dicarboxylate transport system permease small subunit